MARIQREPNGECYVCGLSEYVTGKIPICARCVRVHLPEPDPTPPSPRITAPAYTLDTPDPPNPYRGSSCEGISVTSGWGSVIVDCGGTCKVHRCTGSGLGCHCV